MIIGIDASNINSGGGVTHLVALLKSVNIAALDVLKVVVWGNEELLDAIDVSPWLSKNQIKIVSPMSRLVWQFWRLQRTARRAGCDVLLIPGGSYLGWFSPVVMMSQNMLPFEWQELQRFGWSKVSLRLIFLRFVQINSFRRAAGMIFLTKYAEQGIMKTVKLDPSLVTVIPHGVGCQFLMPPRDPRAIESCSNENPFRLLYVSVITPYKHQDMVAKAVAVLREKKIPVLLDLIGPVHYSGKKIMNTLKALDPDQVFIRYLGEISHTELHTYYEKADLFVFASSCENLPIILLEAMAAGLPIACSNRGPMMDMLKDCAVYFDPENVNQIEKVLYDLITDPDLRFQMAQKLFEQVQTYTWSRCADDTFKFLVEIASNKKSNGVYSNGMNK